METGASSRSERLVRRVVIGLLAAVTAVSVLLLTAFVALAIEDAGSPSASARGTGNDAYWLGHAWVDGRKTQSDVDALAVRLRTTGIHDLFVHAGPFNHDGTLDPALRPRADWLVRALHTALPGTRVQAWLGAHPMPGEFQLNDAASRSTMVASAAQVLDDGFDGVHLDLEPVADGDEDLLTVLADLHAITQRRHAILSVSAVHTAPWRGVAEVITALPGQLSIWSGDYLHRVAVLVDQVAMMSYDTGMLTQATYGGYVRRSTEVALAAVPDSVTLFIGVPAYHDDNLYHHRRAETMGAALHGVRLALGGEPVRRPFGVAIYVDFTVTADDWAAYHRDWAD